MGSPQIINKAIQTKDLGKGSVTTGKIKGGTVTSGKISDGAVMCTDGQGTALSSAKFTVAIISE